MNKYYEQLQQHLEKGMALSEALTLFNWDQETLAPIKSIDNTAKTIGILSSEYFSTLINEEVKSLLEELSKEENRKDLNDAQKSIVKELKKQYEEMEHIPKDEYRAYSELTSKSTSVWAKAKQNNSFEEFAPILKEIIEYQKKFIGYRNKKGLPAYDVLLNDYEEGFNMEKLDLFFDKVKETVIPLLAEVNKKRDTIDKSYNYLDYDVNKQKEFSRFISEYIGYQFDRGVIAESAHPFTTHFHNKDVRITTHYLTKNLESSIFSTIHECGHGIYEMNVDDSITQTPVGKGSSMGIHESQSRFYENIIGRNKSFWTPIYPKLKELFNEQLKDVSLDDFIKGINKSIPSLIRTEADELSYTLHIIIRYEIEKMLFANEITVEDLPRIWNKKYEEYMGLTPKSDTEGVLQDIHWAGGMFGYFPSYAIGSAISAQIYHYMQTKMPVEEYLLAGNIAPITEFLNVHIHKYGATKNTNELLMAMMNEEFNADYYIAYLKEKYTNLYNIEL